MSEITQEDRSLFMRFRMLSARDLAAIQTGEWDSEPDMVAIARHRQAARERALDEAAAWCETATFPNAGDDALKMAIVLGGRTALENAATAIRKLKEG